MTYWIIQDGQEIACCKKELFLSIHMNLQMNIAEDTDQAIKNVEKEMADLFQ